MLPRVTPNGSRYRDSLPFALRHVAFARRHLIALSFAAALCAVTARVGAQTVDVKKPFAAFSASAQSLTDSIVAKARSQIGTRYKLGGLVPNRALDCSGLVKVVMSALNMVLPRTARQQATMGEEIPKDLLEHVEDVVKSGAQESGAREGGQHGADLRANADIVKQYLTV